VKERVNVPVESSVESLVKRHVKASDMDRLNRERISLPQTRSQSNPVSRTARSRFSVLVKVYETVGQQCLDYGLCFSVQRCRFTVGHNPLLPASGRW
jgi:hypothetical protein